MTVGWIFIVLVAEQIVASGTFLAAKWALRDFPPLTLGFARFVIAATGLYLVHRVWPRRKPIERSDRKTFALLGFLAVMVNQAAFLYGLRMTTPTHAAIIYGATPVFVYLLAVPLLRERASWIKFSGVVVTFAGVIVLVMGEGLSWEGKAWLGDLLILAATGAWALYTVLGKSMVAKYGAVHTTAISLITGTVFFIPIGVATWGNFDPSVVRMGSWLSLLYIAIGTSVICYTIWFWALGKLEATKVAVFNNFQPVITALLSLWLMHEVIGVRLIAGGVLVIFGVVLTERG